MLLIGLLRQRGDLDGARRARNAMSEVFPLSEGGRGGKGRGGEGREQGEWKEEGARGVERGGNLYEKKIIYIYILYFYIFNVVIYLFLYINKEKVSTLLVPVCESICKSLWCAIYIYSPCL